MLSSTILTTGVTPTAGIPKLNFTPAKSTSRGGVWRLPPPTILSLPSKTVSFSTTTLVASAATHANPQVLSTPQNEEGRKRDYFVVANARFMLDQEEHFQEQLFERRRHYNDLNLKRDFWLVIEPIFLDNFPNIIRRLSRPAVAFVLTNSSWITFMKLRLDRVLAESYEADTIDEALASSSATPDLEFKKPENWVAPYPKYESGWWETFLPSGSF